MARQYSRKNLPPLPGTSTGYNCSLKQKRDGTWWMVAEISMDYPGSSIERQLPRGTSLREMWDLYKDLLAVGITNKTAYGAKSGHRERFRTKDALVFEVYKKAKERGVSRIFIPDIINGELRMQGFKELTDSRIRAIVARQKRLHP